MSVGRVLRGIRDSAPQGYMLARVSKGKGPLELVKTPAGFLTPNGVVIPSSAVMITLVGDVTGSSASPVTTTIAANVVSNTKLADMAAWTIKARNNAASGDPQDAALADFTEEASPAAGMFIVGWLGTGELRKFDIGNIASVGSWVPTVDGSEPPVFITDGAGVLIFTFYTP